MTYAKYSDQNESVKANLEQTEKNLGLAFVKSKKAKRPYTNMDRAFMQLSGKDLSDLSFRIICYLMSLPDDWVMYMSQLRDQFDVGKDKLQQAIRDLVKKGYIRRMKTRAENGKFVAWHTEYSDLPEFLEDNEKHEAESPGQQNESDNQCLKTRQSDFTAVGKSGTNILHREDHILENNNNKGSGYNKGEPPPIDPPVVVSEDLKKMLESIGLKEPEFWLKTFGEAKIREKFSFMPPKSKITDSEAAWMRTALERDWPPPKNVTTVKNGVSNEEQERLYQQRLKDADELAIREWETYLLTCREHDKPHVIGMINSLRGNGSNLEKPKNLRDVIVSEEFVPEEKSLKTLSEVREKAIDIEVSKQIANQNKTRMRNDQQCMKTFYDPRLSNVLCGTTNELAGGVCG